ncbi:MAG: deoxyribonuclease IV, partial [Thermoplasmata archaeon]
ARYAVRLGAHIGIADGFAPAVASAVDIGCETIQIFSKSPQMWAGPPLTDEAAEEFRTSVRAAHLTSTAIHHGYLVNLASPKEVMVKRSRTAFIDELQRAEKLGVDFLIFHPGAHLGEGPEAGLGRIVESLNVAFAATVGFHVRALLENSSGQGSALCCSPEELASVLSRLDDPRRAGVALDMCHLFANGFDLRTPEGYASFMDRVESVLGRSKVLAFHLNDAKAPLGSHLDRHENIGKGAIGTSAFAHLLNDPFWEETPGYLETPLDDDDYHAYAMDLKVLRDLRGPAPAASKSVRPPRRAGRAKGSGSG